jgi:hypothetical protein
MCRFPVGAVECVPMLQHVAMGQVRFNVPGLAVDSRGVVAGRQMVLRFSALDRLVSFLRLWSADQTLDDLVPGLRLVQVRAPGGSREALVVLPVTSVPLGDSAARAARTVGGQCFTGAGRHFVQYHDPRAPLGYDVTGLEDVDDSTDFVLYGLDHTLAYVAVGDLPLDKLLLRLDLQREQGDVPPRGDVLFLTVRRGLGPLVIEYLFRARRSSPALRAWAAFCEPPMEGTFQRGAAFWILRLENVPASLLGVLSRTPGLTLMAPVADNVAIAVGYRHPVHLGSCKQAFPADRFFLFRSAPAGVTVIAPAPVFSPVADLVRLKHVGPGREPPCATTRPEGTLELVVPLRLEAASTGVGRSVATIVPWQRVGWLRSLCYALPPSVLRGYRLAFLERGLLVVAPDSLDGFPFGQLLYAPAPGLLVPLGWEIRPAISPDELVARVGSSGGDIVIFPGPTEAPFRIPSDSIQSLGARVLADPRLGQLRDERSVGAGISGEEPTEIEVENQPLGPMPLWRLRRES